MRNKRNSLVIFEPYTIRPSNWDIETARRYKRVYTWNRKHLAILKQNGIDAEYLHGFPLCDNDYWLDDFVDYEEKQGVCLVCRYRGRTRKPYDISYKRVEVFENLEGMKKDAFGKVHYTSNY